jgi:glc operon protein GlcG
MSTADHPAPPPKAGPKLPPYGLAITLAQAKKVAAAALAPAHANNWTMVIAIVDPGGHLVYLEKDAIPVEGGLPILVDGKLIGALGVSGGSSAEDEVCAEAGAAALK